MWKHWKSHREVHGQRWLRTAIAWGQHSAKFFGGNYVCLSEYLALSSAIANGLDLIALEALEDAR